MPDARALCRKIRRICSFSGCGPYSGGYDSYGRYIASQDQIIAQEQQVTSSAMSGRADCASQFNTNPDNPAEGPKDKALDYVQCINKVEKEILLPYITSSGLDTSPYLRAHTERERLALKRERGQINQEEYGVEIRGLRNNLEAEMRDQMEAVMQRRNGIRQQQAQQQMQSLQFLQYWALQQQAIDNANRSNMPVRTNCDVRGTSVNCTTWP